MAAKPATAAAPKKAAPAKKGTPINQQPSDWSEKAYLAKAQLYVEQMLGCEDRQDWTFKLWSGLALEHLIRAAASKISPALNAGPNNISQTLFAAGVVPAEEQFVPKTADITSVARALFLAGVLTKESQGFCSTHIDRRNKELHSGNTELAAQGEKWLAEYYRAADQILKSLGLTLEDLVGEDEAEAAIDLIQAADDKTAQEGIALVEAQRTAWDARNKADRDVASQKAAVWATKAQGHRVVCPACKNPSLVDGAPSGPATKTVEDDLIVERQPHLPLRFECVACELKIAGLARLNAVHLGEPYTSTKRYSASAYYGPDDPMDGFDDDNNDY